MLPTKKELTDLGLHNITIEPYECTEPSTPLIIATARQWIFGQTRANLRIPTPTIIIDHRVYTKTIEEAVTLFVEKAILSRQASEIGRYKEKGRGA